MIAAAGSLDVVVAALSAQAAVLVVVLPLLLRIRKDASSTNAAVNHVDEVVAPEAKPGVLNLRQMVAALTTKIDEGFARNENDLKALGQRLDAVDRRTEEAHRRLDHHFDAR